MKHAIIAIEDRASTPTTASTCAASAAPLYQDVVAKQAVQGGSTITQQFVKNALAAQDDRTLFQKLREAALAYHLTRKWSKEQDPAQLPEHDLLRQRRLRHRVGRAHVLRSATTRAATTNGDAALRRRSCEPQEAALLAGDGRLAERATTRSRTPAPPSARRDLVLQRMLEQGYITRAQYEARDRRADPDQRRPPAAARRTPSTRTSPPGSSSRSSTSSAAARPARARRSRAA